MTKAALLYARAAAASVVSIIAPDPIGTSDKSGLLGPQVEGSPDRLHGVRCRRCRLSWSFDWDLDFLFSFQMTGSRLETGQLVDSPKRTAGITVGGFVLQESYDICSMA